MKRTLKKIVALVTVLSMLLLTVPTFAHSGSVGVTDIQKTMKGYSSPSKSPYQVLYMGATMSTEKITIMYTNKKIGTVKKQKVTNPLGETRVIFTFVPKQAGTIKIGSKTYKTQITILKYKNPIVSITINGKKISGSKFNKTDVIKLNYNTYKGKKNKITYQIKNGWSGNLAACDKNDSTLYGAVTADMSSETFTLQNGKGNFNLKFSLRDANGVENKVVIAFKSFDLSFNFYFRLIIILFIVDRNRVFIIFSQV